MHRIYENKKELISKYYFIVILFLPLVIVLYLSDQKILAAFCAIPIFIVTLSFLQRSFLPALEISQDYLRYYKYGFFCRSKKILFEKISYIQMSQPLQHLRSPGIEAQDNIFKLIIYLKDKNKKIKVNLNPKAETQQSLKRIIEKYSDIDIRIEHINFETFNNMKKHSKK